jgi:hypothetical protein
MSAFPLLGRAGVPTVTDAGALGTVLGVWAHPDDEAFLSAGLIPAAEKPPCPGARAAGLS